MALFAPRTFNEILSGMMAKLLSVTPLTDVNFGSVWTTLLEAAAQEDDEQYFQMTEIIRGYSLDTVFGTDLDDRGAEYNLTRGEVGKASSYVTISDSAVTKVETTVYAGLSGAPAGALSINGSSNAGFTDTGSIIIGRNTANNETVVYTSVTIFPNYVKFNLATALVYDHGTEETIILSQGGTRVIGIATIVKVPQSDLSAELSFTTDAAATIQDGESEVTLVPVTASVAGADSNVPIGAISTFGTLPFPTAVVKNPYRITNGVEAESDQEYRDRIKNTIQSLSRGTVKAIETGVANLLSETDNKRVASTSIREPVIAADVVKMFIDDGTGFIPTIAHVGEEVIVLSATGGEKYVGLDNFPVVKASVETMLTEPFAIANNETLTVSVNGKEEVITFIDSDFATSEAATAQEVVTKINSASSSFESRLSSSGDRVRIFSRSNSEEEIVVTGGSANDALSFPTDLKYSTKLYLIRGDEIIVLNKDGKTASVESGSVADFDMSSASTLTIIVDGKTLNPLTVDFDPSMFAHPLIVPAQEIVDIINAACPGLVASVSSAETRITLTSMTRLSSLSKIKVNSGGSNTVFDFPTTEVVGQDKDYAINRYLGQIELVTPLTTGDKLTAGTTRARAFVVATGVGPYAGLPTTTLSVDIDGMSKTIVFSVDDFADIVAATATEVAAAITARLPGVTGLVSSDGMKVVIQSNRHDTGTIQVADTGANSILKFPATLTTSMALSHVGAIESAREPFALGISDTILIVADDNFSGVFSAPLFVAGTVTGVTSQSTFAASALIGTFTTDDEISGYDLYVDSGAKASPDPIEILNYTKATGTIELTGALPSPVEITTLTEGPYSGLVGLVLSVIIDDHAYSVLFDTSDFENPYAATALEVCTAINSKIDSTHVSPGNPSGTATVSATNMPVITSDDSATGTVVVTDTGANLILGFQSLLKTGDTFKIVPKSVNQVIAFWMNKQVTLLSNSVEVLATDAGRRIQLASKLPGEDGSIEVTGGTGNTVLAFSPSRKVGIDGYKYFTGLAQKVQWTVDGKPDDQTNYPGIRAAGVQVEVIEPVSIPIKLSLRVVAAEGYTVSSVASDIRSAISTYINKLGVGDDVILSDIVVAAKSITGVFDAIIESPSLNVVIADSELARVSESDISIT
jgi:uncharacterized phage protein gp47/JayE